MRTNSLTLSSDLCVPAVAHLCSPHPPHTHKWNQCKNKMLFNIGEVELRKLCKQEGLSLCLQHLRKRMAWLVACCCHPITKGWWQVDSRACWPSLPFSLGIKTDKCWKYSEKIKSVLKNFPQSRILWKEAKFLATWGFYQIPAICFRKTEKFYFHGNKFLSLLCPVLQAGLVHTMPLVGQACTLGTITLLEFFQWLQGDKCHM